MRISNELNAPANSNDLNVDFKEQKGDKDLFDKLFDAKQDSLKKN